MKLLTSVFILLATAAFAQEKPPPTEAEWGAAMCGMTPDGMVACPVTSFKLVTDSLIEAQEAVGQLRLQLMARDAQVEALKAALLAVSPPLPPPSHVKPITAVITSVLGTMALSVAILTDTLSPAARVGLGITGAAAVAGSFVIVF